MKLKTTSRSLALVLCLALSACTEPGETTAIGAATGGILGAGLGAIVGNQTGSAGGGLTIGAVAGAGAGAAIGNALEAQQKAVRTQDEAIERQQKMLAAQKVEINELRNMPRDAPSALDRSLAEQSGSRASYRGNLRGPDSDPNVTTDELNRGADLAQKRARDSIASMPRQNFDMAPAPVPQNQARFSEPQAAPIAEARAAIRPSTSGISERSLSPEIAPRVSQPEVVAKRSETTTIATVGGAECEKAITEAEKASGSKEPADKLFYLRRAIRLCPSRAEYHKQLADEYAQLGRNEDAKASYEQALKLDPSLSEAKSGMASLSSNAY